MAFERAVPLGLLSLQRNIRAFDRAHAHRRIRLDLTQQHASPAALALLHPVASHSAREEPQATSARPAPPRPQLTSSAFSFVRSQASPFQNNPT